MDGSELRALRTPLKKQHHELRRRDDERPSPVAAPILPPDVPTAAPPQQLD